jgi:Uma2 family endonuclease
MSEAELDQSRFWTEAEYWALEETNSRIELVDGHLVVTPSADNAHQEIAHRLKNALAAAAGAAHLRVPLTPNLYLGPGRLVIPDLAVGRYPRSTTRNSAKDTVVVIEVTSPSNASTHREEKMRLYAEAGIPWYLLLEPDFSDYESLTVHLLRLDGGRYVEHAVAKDGELLSSDEPFALSLDIGDLLNF